MYNLILYFIIDYNKKKTEYKRDMKMDRKQKRKKLIYIMGAIGLGCMLSVMSVSRPEAKEGEVIIVPTEVYVPEIEDTDSDIEVDIKVDTETDAEDTSEIIIEGEEDTGNSEDETEGEIQIEEETDAEQKVPSLKTPVLTASVTKDGIKLTWKKISHAKQYEIYRKETSSGSYKRLKTTKNTSYTDKKAKYGVSYTYKVRAIATVNDKKVKSKFSKQKKAISYHIDPSKPMVALTYDDGPSQYTAGILDVLKKYHAHATFFELGNRVNWYPKTVKRIIDEGCELGNHSYDHAFLGSASKSSIQQQLSATDKELKAVAGVSSVLFRPPYGAIGTNMKKYANKPLILWSIDTLDWESRNATSIYNKVMSNVSDGDIILMHDIYHATEKATEQIVPALIKKGYQLVTVSEMAEYKGIKLKNGGRYAQM